MPEVWLIRIISVGGLFWCARTFATPAPPLPFRSLGWASVLHSRFSAVVVAVIFATMLVLSFR